jgi:hypothetical protein
MVGLVGVTVFPFVVLLLGLGDLNGTGDALAFLECALVLVGIGSALEAYVGYVSAVEFDSYDHRTAA